jgi:hypothetical protein
MDPIETPETDEISFGKTLVKDYAETLATSAGLLTGVVLVAFAFEQIQKVRARRKAKKNQIKTES